METLFHSDPNMCGWKVHGAARLRSLALQVRPLTWAPFEGGSPRSSQGHRSEGGHFPRVPSLGPVPASHGFIWSSRSALNVWRPVIPTETDWPLHLLNREVSWLDFNARVLAIAVDPQTPLLKRAKFQRRQ